LVHFPISFQKYHTRFLKKTTTNHKFKTAAFLLLHEKLFRHVFYAEVFYIHRNVFALTIFPLFVLLLYIVC